MAVCGQHIQGGVGIEAELFLHLERDGLAGRARFLAQAGQGGGFEGRVGCVHWIDPASSKMGM
jgi:hypothetical protein